MPGRVFPRYVLTQPWEYPAMNLKQRFLRLGLAAVLLGSLGACTVVPAYPSSGYYRAPAPAYVETYPTYGYPSANVYYDSGYRQYDGRGGRYYRDDRYYDNRHREHSPIEDVRRLRRDIHRSLGLP